MEFSKKAIFIGGIPRSGTRLMMNILNQHREIAAFGETKIISHQICREFPDHINRAPAGYQKLLLELFKELCLDRFYSYWDDGGLNTAELKPRNLVDALCLYRFQRPGSVVFKSPLIHIHNLIWEFNPFWGKHVLRKYSNLNISGTDHADFMGLYTTFERAEISAAFFILQKLLDDISLEECYKVYGRFWNHIFTGYAKKQNKRYWAEKTPANAFYGSLFARWFEDVKVINIVRDGRDVACSAKSRWPWRDHKSTLERWAKHLKRALKDQALMSEGSYVNIRYEDLVQEPKRTIERLSGFMGIDVDEKMLSDKISNSSVGRYKTSFSAELTAYAGERYGDILERWGYEV